MSPKPIHTCILTHGHVDHCTGLLAIERSYATGALRCVRARPRNRATTQQHALLRNDGVAAEGRHKRPQVVAHKNMQGRFDRYLLTRGLNETINSRQFQVKSKFPQRYPKIDSAYAVRRRRAGLWAGRTRVGADQRACVHARPSATGPDHAPHRRRRVPALPRPRRDGRRDVGVPAQAPWCVQARGILMYVVWRVSVVAICTGDLFIWATPNCGNPQKVRYVSKVCSKRKSQTEAMRGLWCAPQVQRYPREWSAALKKMLKLDAEYLLPGHGMR